MKKIIFAIILLMLLPTVSQAGNLFNGVCFETLAKAADAEISSPYQVSTSGIVYPVSYAVPSGSSKSISNTVYMVFNYQLLVSGKSNSSVFSVTVPRKYASCAFVPGNSNCPS
jgi:hypothetical protein